ncbi:MAG: regulator of CtrA degradation rcdA [Robiginitomaculum sp.]|nr:MAG: regulator of CtrA degradation rcdA [Robiginitomaculum sp.]
MTDEFATRLNDFTASELFSRSFREGMDLVEEAAAYLDGPGREESRALPRNGALAYAGESMRLTTRLMQVASWLLVQRAVRENEMTIEDACDDKYRLGTETLRRADLSSDQTPATLLDLIRRTDQVFERISRLDDQIYGEAGRAAQTNVVSDQHARLSAAFGQR